MPSPGRDHYIQTSGSTDPVWVHNDQYSNRPQFRPLIEDIETDVCVIGAGIAGISVAHELVARGHEVVLIEARETVSGESGRTSGHLSNALDDGYTNIKKKHGRGGAQAAADSHTWALNHVGEVARKHGIECEYRHVPAYKISQFERGDSHHGNDVEAIKEEVELAKQLGLDADFREGLAVKGWTGKPDQRDGAVFANQAAFHPTLYLVGVLNWLKEQPNFRCHTLTRMLTIEEGTKGILGMGGKSVTVKTEGGNTIQCEHAVEATCVPLQKLSIIAEMSYNRTYCIAIRVPRGSVEDCFIYDSADQYKYVRLTPCDERDDFLIVGGCDHKVGQESPAGRFEDLEAWTRERFAQAGTVDYRWSGQVYEPVDLVAFIGKNQGCERIYVVTGDSGNGLTHGVIAGRLLADEIEGKENPWAGLYSPKRILSIAKSAPEMLAHDVQINTQYKRFLESDIGDIEDLARGSGGVLNKGLLSKPVAIYKDEDGQVTRMSALCPHMKGIVCWNPVEKSFDCPVHGSRFSGTGICVEGPAKANLPQEA
ncbi:DAO-domain-containing protein [Phialemonium atrogriseum]|uniref:DAO-domain-containing protein n=1 Tax=Phialemonium atrogriseum TaxID=1093897 RepID=A0AAJ0BRE1_9PEZI|nr:DAO-domain-containing protein [Phialemonium atrogriseum]KAK1762850.1 DAO-domain-containing protein [Phialemonium atrogriseum]